MAKHRIHRFRAPPIDVKRYAVNGHLPSSVVMRRCANAYNSAGGGLRRLLGYSMPWVLSAPLDNFGGSFIFRTGVGFERITAIILLQSPPFAGSSPEARLYIHDDVIGTGSPIVSNWARRRSLATATVTSSNITAHVLSIPAAQFSEKKLYWGSIQLRDYAALRSCVVFEEASFADDASVQFCNPSVFSDDEPIIASHVQDVIESSDSVWRHGGASLFLLAGSDLGFGFNIASTTYTNILNNTSTTVSSSTPGPIIDSLYRASKLSVNMSVELGVHARRPSGTSTLDVRVTDGTTNLDFTGISPTHGALAITSIVRSLPRAAAKKWDVQARVSNAAEPWIMRSVGMWTWLP